VIAAHVRLAKSTEDRVLAFVSVPGDHEARVRWSPGNWRCDVCGPSPWPTCAHTRAVINSDTYTHETTATAAFIK